MILVKPDFAIFKVSDIILQYKEKQECSPDDLIEVAMHSNLQILKSHQVLCNDAKRCYLSCVMAG